MIAEEARTDHGISREFQVLDARSLEVQKTAKSAGALKAFGRYAFSEWRRTSLALR